jgi:uncharacterized protein (DUF1697 family)
MARLVALLRGINVGRNRRVPMADLRALMEELGYEDVRTLLQSGNVVFSGAKAKAGKRLEAGLEERFGMKIEVVLRTMAELKAVVDDEPFGEEADDLTRYFVVFLSETPDAGALSEFRAQDWGPDKLAANGRELYTWCPEGMQNSRLMRALVKPKFAAAATTRNMSTVKKLLE